MLWQYYRENSQRRQGDNLGPKYRKKPAMPRARVEGETSQREKEMRDLEEGNILAHAT